MWISHRYFFLFIFLPRVQTIIRHYYESALYQPYLRSARWAQISRQNFLEACKQCIADFSGTVTNPGYSCTCRRCWGYKIIVQMEIRLITEKCKCRMWGILSNVCLFGERVPFQFCLLILFSSLFMLLDPLPGNSTFPLRQTCHNLVLRLKSPSRSYVCRGHFSLHCINCIWRGFRMDLEWVSTGICAPKQCRNYIRGNLALLAALQKFLCNLNSFYCSLSAIRQQQSRK